jgi:hypothetical protein
MHPFNASDVGWLERSLIDVLLETPPELVPSSKEEILERTVAAALGVLGVLGAYILLGFSERLEHLWIG